MTSCDDLKKEESSFVTCEFTEKERVSFASLEIYIVICNVFYVIGGLR